MPNKLNAQLPTEIRGIDGKVISGETAYNKIINESPKDLTTKVKTPTLSKGELSFITYEKQYQDIIDFLDLTFPNYTKLLSNDLSFEENVMKGSNTYIAVAVDMYLKSIKSEYRLATQLNLEQNLTFPQDTYDDSGLALRNLNNENKNKANYLYEQLRQKGIKTTDFPLFLNLRGLRLDNNLNFNLTDESFYKTAKCLNWQDETKFSQVNECGLPEKQDDFATRQIYTSNNALSRCYRDRDSSLYSYNSNLSSSNSYGRVVLVKCAEVGK